MGNTRVTRRPNLARHRFFAWAIIGGFLAVCSTMLFIPEAASAQGSSRTGIEIDHSSTGFPLSGGHAQVVCERCHLQGIFRGTPTQCMQCHSPGGRVVSTFKPTNHIPTTVNCNSCHRTTNWTPAFFTHNGVAPGTCSRCHNQTIASGKPATHIPTTKACDTCHKSTTTFVGAAFNHTGIVSGCATCHNGSTALGKPANHIPVATACETCHKSTTAFSGSRYHSSVVATPGQCNTCHERGMNWLGVQDTRPSDHNGNEAAPNSCDRSGCHNTRTFDN